MAPDHPVARPEDFLDGVGVMTIGGWWDVIPKSTPMTDAANSATVTVVCPKCGISCVLADSIVTWEIEEARGLSDRVKRTVRALILVEVNYLSESDMKFSCGVCGNVWYGNIPSASESIPPKKDGPRVLFHEGEHHLIGEATHLFEGNE